MIQHHLIKSTIYNPTGNVEETFTDAQQWDQSRRHYFLVIFHFSFNIAHYAKARYNTIIFQ